jgi:hypothetical protein
MRFATIESTRLQYQSINSLLELDTPILSCCTLPAAAQPFGPHFPTSTDLAPGIWVLACPPLGANRRRSRDSPHGILCVTDFPPTVFPPHTSAIWITCSSGPPKDALRQSAQSALYTFHRRMTFAWRTRLNDLRHRTTQEPVAFGTSGDSWQCACIST